MDIHNQTRKVGMLRYRIVWKNEIVAACAILADAQNIADSYGRNPELTGGFAEVCDSYTWNCPTVYHVEGGSNVPTAQVIPFRRI